jgi:hypothetical protein
MRTKKKVVRIIANSELGRFHNIILLFSDSHIGKQLMCTDKFVNIAHLAVHCMFRPRG